MRKVVHIALALLLLGGGFLWGFTAHRKQLFPYPQIKSLAKAEWVRAAARKVGLGDELPGTLLDRREAMLHRPPRDVGRRRTLETLPYVTGTRDPNPERRGVILHEPGETWPGLNLYGPETEPVAYLVDMEGKVVYRWSVEGDAWQHRELLPDGSLLAIVVDQAVLKLDRDSNLLWRRPGRFHHGLWVDGDGTIYALTEVPEAVPAIHGETETLVDYVTILSPEGEVLERFSLLDLILESPYAFLLTRIDDVEMGRGGGPIDPVHANHVEVFDGRLADRSPLFARGNLLLSLRNPNLIVILDAETREIVWAWGPNNLMFQHQPTLLDNGHLLVFDNGVERSRVLELDPLDPSGGRIVWSYAAEDFFSESRGSVQRLGNGNTLITESDTGYVFEVTPEGERVWIFAGPHFTGDGKRATIWRMTRHRPDDLDFPFRGRDALRSGATP